MKRAFTLIELLVYMAIMSFVIIVAGRVFSDSTSMRVRSQNMIRNSEEVGRVYNLIKEDISQMGVKAWGHNASVNDYTVHKVETENPEIYWNKDNGDVSSYALKHRIQPNGTFRDSIVFRKAAFDDNGLFLGIREIVWEARNDSLFRRCATIKKECPSSNACGSIDNDAAVCPSASSANANDIKPVLIAKNIVNFKIVPSAPGMKGNTQEQDTLFGKYSDPNFKLLSKTSGTDIVDISTSIDNSGTVKTVRDFAQNSNDPTGKRHNELYLSKNDKNAYNECEKMTFNKDETYSIEFKMPYQIPSDDDPEQLKRVLSSTQFVPSRDHLAIGLRTNMGDKINNAPNDILFYPAQFESANNLTRHLEFSVKDTVKNACMAITIAYYPPNVAGFNAANGLLKFSEFKVFRNADETFHFLKEGETGYDENYGTENRTPAQKIKEKPNAKAFELMLEIETKGEKAGTYASEGKGMVITTPNNGVIPKD